MSSHFALIIMIFVAYFVDILEMCFHLKPFTYPANLETTDLSGRYILLV
jgi:hypothetical protein